MGEKPTYRGPRWLSLRRRVFKRDGFRCQDCGKAGRLEADHVKPISQGGDFWNPENLQSLCRNCHIAKTARENTDRRAAENPQRTAWRHFRDELREG